MSDLSWWTEDNNDFVMQYLDNQLRSTVAFDVAVPAVLAGHVLSWRTSTQML